MHSASGCNGHQRPAQPEDRNITSYNFRNHALDSLSSGIRMVSGAGKYLVQSADCSSSVAVPLRVFTSAEDETLGYDWWWGSCLRINSSAVSGNQRIYSVSDFVLRPDSGCMVDVGHQGKAKQRYSFGNRNGCVSRSSDSL